MASSLLWFFCSATAASDIYSLSLHDALPICSPRRHQREHNSSRDQREPAAVVHFEHVRDRKSTRLNSSHSQISYAVFCLKKKTHRTEPDRKNTRLNCSDSSIAYAVLSAKHTP